ncbi:unnamed protein product [Discula destructiva]
MVDSEEHIVEPTEIDAEKDSLAIINPDSLETGTEQLQVLSRADDYDAIKEIVLPPLVEEPKILSDTLFTWKVENWRQQNKKEHGPIFQAGGFPWRILLFPYGNNVEQVSIYLEHGFEANEIPDEWSCCTQFALVLWNPNDPTIFHHHSAHHRFTKEESDWGFTKFLETRKLYAPWETSPRPMIEDDTVNITVYVRHVEDETGVLWHNFTNYDSKKETGFVGLKNQGATCYLNSLLQSLYFTNAFRKAVYEIPTQEDESMTNSAYTLQRLFYQLQTANAAVGTNELTKSFGWETRHIFEQQDVQELSRKLMERMEEKMKGTKAENVLPQMFSGKIKTYISCINVDYESSRIEDFWDVQLNVSGNKSLQDSFQDYIQVEKMDGENQYMAGDQYKLQDANKGVIFMSFPDVLHLQLKRFEYDYMRDTMTKINDRYEFPETFDAAPYLSDDADKTQNWTYQLHGVLVHSGDLNAGHYYAFLKPNKEGWFYKYDDDKVTKATRREVLEDNFGGEYRQPTSNPRTPLQRKAPIMRPNSAYMLVYIRQTKVDNILCPVTEEDIPRHLRLRFDEEAAIREARRREREEQHLYMAVKAILPSTFEQHGGTDLANFEGNPDQDPSAPKVYRTLRSSTIQDVVNRIAEDIHEDPKRVRLWLMVNRQNKTVRPDTPMMDVRLTVEETYNKSASHNNNTLRVWVEVAEEVTADGDAVWPTYNGPTTGLVARNELILLFLKNFDVESQSLHGVGHVYINKEKKVEDLAPLICKKMGWGDKLPGDDKITLWEEIKPTMIENLKPRQTLKLAELQDGDILCFQRHAEKKTGIEKKLGFGDKASEEPIRPGDRCEDAKQYYDFLQYKRTVRFHAHPQRTDGERYPPFELVLSAKISYDQLAERVGAELGVDPTHIRFHTVNNSGAPRLTVKRSSTNQTLQSILNPGSYAQLNQNQSSNALYFEVLDMSLAELDTKKSIKISWLSEGITKEESFDILVPKSGIIEDVIHGLIKKAQLPDEAEAGKIRIFEANNHRFFRDMSREYPVISINEYTNLLAERIAPEEADATEKDFINCFHFQNEASRPHGVPFRFLVIEGEKFIDTRKRLEKRTGLKGKSFEKIKFALVRRPYSKTHYLQDDDVLSALATEPDDQLGLDHVDRTRTLRNGVGDLFLK